MSRSYFVLRVDRDYFDKRDEARLYAHLIEVRDLVANVLPNGTLHIMGKASTELIAELAAEFGDLELLGSFAPPKK